MENNNTPQANEATCEKKAVTDAERYPLIVSPIYRGCVEKVINHVRKRIASLGGTDDLLSSPIKQLAKAGHLNADFMLRHFAGIFDGNSPLSADQRQAIKSILTAAAGEMTQISISNAQKQEEQKLAQRETKEKQKQTHTREETTDGR